MINPNFDNELAEEDTIESASSTIESSSNDIILPSLLPSSSTASTKREKKSSKTGKFKNFRKIWNRIKTSSSSSVKQKLRRLF